jgi:hypothetical protein
LGQSLCSCGFAGSRQGLVKNQTEERLRPFP